MNKISTPIIHKYDAESYYSSLVIPDTWDNVIKFAEWYLENKMAIRILDNQEIFVTDISTSWIMFRHGRFQAEMYLLPSNLPDTPRHSHPNIDVATISISYAGDKARNKVWGLPRALAAGNSHDSMTKGQGALFITCEHWKDGVEMTSAAVNWNGKLCGPVHANLIKKYYPTAIIGNDMYWNVADASC
jgi:hypothetical protein